MIRSIRTVAFHEVRVINSPYTFIIPTFDGSIDTVSEWGDAVTVDISDVLGRYGSAEAAGSVILYAKNDSTHLYLAISHRSDTTLDDGDGPWLYADDDHDGNWAGDDSEGVYAEDNFAAGDTVRFWAIPGYVPYAVAGASVRVELTDGHVQHEFSLPVGASNYELNAALGDTIASHWQVYDAGGGGCQGWWPTAVAYSDYENPPVYGDMVLGIGPGVEEQEPGDRSKGSVARLFQNCPNPFAGYTVVSYQLAVDNHVVLTVYDTAGRVVRTLLNEQMLGGYHSIVWDGKTVSGRRVGSGVYFYRLQLGDFDGSKKLVVLR